MEVTDALLRDGATTPQEAQLWAQLSRDLDYILVSVCSGQAALLCRQHSTQAQGLETGRQLHNRFSIPVGTCSVGYCTKLLKPQFNEQKFEESFTTWEFEIAPYERDNQAPIPNNIKIAVPLNETKGALQLIPATPSRYKSALCWCRRAHSWVSQSKHGIFQDASPTTSTQHKCRFNRPTTNGHRPDAQRKRKARAKERATKDKVKERHNGTTKESTNTNWFGNAFKGSGYTPVKGKTEGKGPPTWQGDKGKGKGACYKCGQMGHMARDCRVRVHNVAEATGEQSMDQQHYYEEQYNQQQYDPHYQQWNEQEAWQYE